jgi:hypothetical protein
MIAEAETKKAAWTPTKLHERFDTTMLNAVLLFFYIEVCLVTQ